VPAGPKTAAASAQPTLSIPQPSVQPHKHQQAATESSMSHGNGSSRPSTSSGGRNDGSAFSHSSSYAAGRAISSSESDQPLLSETEMNGVAAQSQSKKSTASFSSQLPGSSNRASSSAQMPGDTLHSKRDRSIIGGESGEQHADAEAAAAGKPEASETKIERLKKHVLAGKGATTFGSGNTSDRLSAGAQLAGEKTAWAYTGGSQKWNQQLVLPKGSPVLILASDFEQQGQYQ